MRDRSFFKKKWMMRLPASQKRLMAIQGCLAWTFLNLFININYPGPKASMLQLILPSLEVWGVLLILSMAAGCQTAFRPCIYLPLMIFLLFCRFFRLGDVLMPVYFNRPFNLYMDTGYVPDLIHLLAHSFTLPQLSLYALISVAGSMVVLWMLWKSLKILYQIFGISSCRKIFWLLTAGEASLVVLFLFGHYPAQWMPPATACTPRIIEEAAFIADVKRIKQEGISAVQMDAKRVPPLDAPLEKLKPNNVYIFLIESYGQTLFANAKYISHFVPVAEDFSEALEKARYAICSNFWRSPTFGGASWLAFGTLESGVWLPNQIRYNFLLSSDVKPLAGYFNRAGYRTVSVMPGTTMPWPEGDFFQYRRSYYAKDFDYQGPSFGWSPMPDQFVLDAIYRREILNSSQPLFIRFVLNSSHAPFHRQPRYVVNWDQIGNGAVYQHIPPVIFPNNWPDLTQSTEAYLTAMAYEFEVLKAFLIQFVEDDALIIIAGDHQPNAHLTGPNTPPLTPVHILSRKGQFLEPFLQKGYTSGMIPDGSLPHLGMDGFLADFLVAFSR